MTYYKYRAQDADGKHVSGVLMARDEQDLHEKLKADNKFLISAKIQNNAKLR